MEKIEKLVKKLIEHNKTISTMESCTGGGLANIITNIPGASNVLKYSAVTYSDEYKVKMGVSKQTIDKYGVYSIETAMNMAKNISKFTNSDYGIGITGKINHNAYISIYEKNEDRYFNYFLELENADRIANKNEIILLVANKLLEML